MTAYIAFLTRRFVTVNEADFACFVSELSSNLRERRITYGPRKVMVGKHAFDVQVFKADNAIPA